MWGGWPIVFDKDADATRPTYEVPASAGPA